MTEISKKRRIKAYINGFNEDIQKDKAKIEEIKKAIVEEIQKDKAKVEEEARKLDEYDEAKVQAYREGLVKSGSQRRKSVADGRNESLSSNKNGHREGLCCRVP